MTPIRVFVVDDEALVRRALAVFSDGADDLEVIGEASDGAAAVRRCASARPDVVLMDVQMPVMDGIEATAQLRRQHPGTRVIALTTFSSERFIVPVLRAGAAGYLVKDTEPDDLVAAIRDVHAGGFALSPGVTRSLIEAVKTAPPPVTTEASVAAEASRPAPAPAYDETPALSERELDVLELLGEGLSNAEIGRRLHLSEATVKTHMSRVMTKWGVRDRVQVLIRAARMSLIRL